MAFQNLYSYSKEAIVDSKYFDDEPITMTAKIQTEIGTVRHKI